MMKCLAPCVCVFMIFHGSRLVFLGLRSVFMVFKVPLWFFMVSGEFLWLFMALGWYFMVPGLLLWFQVGFHDSSWVFMIFHYSKSIFS